MKVSLFHHFIPWSEIGVVRVSFAVVFLSFSWPSIYVSYWFIVICEILKNVKLKKVVHMVRILLTWLVECGRFREYLDNNAGRPKWKHRIGRMHGSSLRSWQNLLRCHSRDPRYMSLIDSSWFVKFSKMSNFNFQSAVFVVFSVNRDLDFF
jgi:hypothetical protein